MKTYLDCIPCFMNQALRAGRLATGNEMKHRELLNFTADLMCRIDLEKTPAENGAAIYAKVRELSGIDDPYKAIKQESISEAKALYAELKERIRKSDNPLLTAVRIAIAGNIIDFGIDKKFDIHDDLNRILHQDFAIFDFNDFVKSLNAAQNILYLGDNAGESVFDKLLIETMNKPVVYATREVPVINDVVIQDAMDSGLNDVAKIISSGSPAPGIILPLCNHDFLTVYDQADMVISKGQGNYEGLSDAGRPVFFLLKAKCPVIARDLNVKVNDIILMKQQKN